MKNVFKIVVWLTLLFPLLYPSITLAQLVINEFSSGTSDDWVELYNSTAETVNLSEWIIRDSTTNKIDLSGEISGQSFAAFDFSNRLNNDGDTVKLFKMENGTEVFKYEISFGENADMCKAESNQSIGRVPNGSGDFQLTNNPTKNLSNSEDVTDCPDPTPSPNPSPTSDPSLAPTATPKSSSSPTPKSTPKTSLKPSQKNSPSFEPSGEVLSEITPSISPEATVLGESTKSASIKFPMGILFVGVGIVLSGGAGYLAYKQSLKQKFVE